MARVLLGNATTAYAVCFQGQNPNEESSEGSSEEIFYEIRFFDPETQSEIPERKVVLRRQSVVIQCAKKNLLIVKYEAGVTNKGLLALDVNTGEVRSQSC